MAENPVDILLAPSISWQSRATSNVSAAGFEIKEVREVYLDVVKTILAVAPGQVTCPGDKPFFIWLFDQVSRSFCRSG